MFINSRRGGFSLIEVMVSVILIGLGVSFVTVSLTTGKYFLKRAENEATAMSIAFARKEALLAKSFDTLEAGILSSTQGIFTWQTEVIEDEECDTTLVPPQCIPFKEINVQVWYREQGISPLLDPKYKKISLKNMVPYPYLHFEEATIDASCTVGEGCGIAFFAGGYPANSVVGDDADDNSLRAWVSYPVDKDVVVVYNIAVDVEDGTGIEGADTIFSRVFLNDVAVSAAVEARTPIVSQPLISNIVEIDNLQRRDENNPHKIEVRWYKDTASGHISVKRANLILVAYERQN